MYVCMYVHVYVHIYTYVCKYVCMYVCIRKNWSNEACIDTLKLGIRYAAAKVLRRAQKVVDYCSSA